MVKLVGVRFKKACRVYDFKSNGLELRLGDMVVVEVEKGLGMGAVAYGPREVDLAAYPRPLKRVIRKADTVDLERHTFNSEREDEALRICREKIAQYNLPMKLVRVEYLFDSSKAIFYFTSETRVDFRELVKDLAAAFHTRIEMRQIGVRDEAKMLGGIGPCGRVLCCTSHLSDFEPVTIKMAKDQNLALNPVKISGICGRLMCCLSYEHRMYQEMKRDKKAPAAVPGALAGEGEQAGHGCGGGCHGAVQGRGADKGASLPGTAPVADNGKESGGAADADATAKADNGGQSE